MVFVYSDNQDYNRLCSEKVWLVSYLKELQVEVRNQEYQFTVTEDKEKHQILMSATLMI